MDRLSKKCVITSAIVHGTLVLVLLVGPAFLGSDSKSEASQPILTIIPDIALSSGATVIGQGRPDGGRPAPPQPTPAPLQPPKPEPEVRPEPRPEPRLEPRSQPTKPVEPPKPTTESPEATDKPRKPQINLTPIVRKPSNSATKPNTSAADAKAEARAEAQRAARRFEAAANNIEQGASSGVEVGPVGVSTGTGRSVGAYSDILRSIYFNGWREPSDATTEDAVVKVSVTIRNNGEVISARITKSSGDQAVDRSVQHLIDSITFVRPFPEDWSERQKEFKLSFSLKAKRSLG